MNDLQQRAARALAAFGLPPASRIDRLGGTASDAAVASCGDRRWVVRWRNAEFAHVDYIRFDHACLTRLAVAGLPTPVPQRAPSGNTWIADNMGPVEVLSYVSGTPLQNGDHAAIADVGRTLAKFHEALADSPPAGKDGFVREDHPDLLAPYLAELNSLSSTNGQLAALQQISAELQLVRSELDSGLYDQLPQTVIHGDIHPGNIAFEDSRVSAIYDFDYMSWQARVRDLVDALMFFGAVRQSRLDANDIWSLTAPYELLSAPSTILVQAYHRISPLTDLDWQGMAWLLRSQWCQIRLRGSRKIPQDRRVAFVIDGFSEMIARIEFWQDSLLSKLRDACP